MPAASFQAILDNALVSYRKQIGVELDKHTFADELRGLESPNDILKLLEDKANAFKVYRDGNRKLIKWLRPVVQVIHALSGVFGQVVPFQPGQAIFNGIDVLITAADGVSSSYDALVDLFECIGNFLNRLRIYTDVPMSSSMTDIIIKIMVELLSVFALATKQIKEGRFKKFAKKLLGEREIEAVLQRLDRLTQEEGKMTVAQTLEVVHGLVNNVKVVMNDGKASTDGIWKALYTMQQMASEINKMRRDQMQKESKNWLCPPDPSKNYNIGCQTHRDGTATWFFQGSVFDEWNARGSLLWIHGKPGSGKTILLSSIIQNIDSKRKAGLASLAYFYFDFRDIEKQHLHGLLSSFVSQLSAESEPCHQILSRLYSNHAGGTREPSEHALSQCLREMFEVPGQPAIYIIIDALDECPNTSGMPTARERVLEFLVEDLVKLNLPNVHICASSRQEIDIRNAFEPLGPFHMSLHDESGQKEDICSYVSAVVHSDQMMRRWRDGDKQSVIDTLSNKADGMFRWVSCQLEILRWTLPMDIRSSLDNMPKTLDETYERALLAINEAMRQYAQRLFQCLAVSIRPLRVEELADVLAVQLDAGALPKFNPDWRLGDAEEAVLSVCSNLISVVDVDGSQVVQFSHFSVKEFLISDRLATAREDLSGYHIVLQSAHTILAQASLGALLHLDAHIDRDSVENFPLSSYAAHHWVDHGQFGDVSSAIQVAMELLFNPKKPHFAIWVWIYDMDDPWRGEMHTTHPEQPEASPLYYAVLCGFRRLIEHLIASYPEHVDARGGYYQSPLLAAFIKEDVDIALSLLKQGADVNVLDKSGTSPLHRASRAGSIDIVRLLLEHNADTELQSVKGSTPLKLASAAGELEVSRLLLQWGANVHTPDEEGRSPLHRAAHHGHLDVVRFLIESNAVIGSRDKKGWTPLHSASFRGNGHIAELLIRYRADVDHRDNYSLTPLHLASQEGHVKTAELLIEHGADIGSRDNDGCTPLHLASSRGRIQVAEFLIRHGANVGSRAHDGRTPLHWAALGGHLDVVKLLLERGADRNIRDGKNKTPWDLASDHEKLEALSRSAMSLGREANPSASHVNRRNPRLDVVQPPRPHGGNLESSNNEQPSLHTASRHGQVDVVRLLLDQSSNIEEVDDSRQTALAVASMFGQLEVANLLIESGANVDSRDKDGWTPLHQASDCGQLQVVSLLLDHKADLDARQRNQMTALDLATRSGHLEVAELLLKRGADPNARNGFWRTPRQEALAFGHCRIAQLLLEHGASSS